MSTLRAAASVKPGIVLKAGRSDADSADAIFDAALRRAGAVRVRYFVQLFSAVKVLGYTRRPKGRRVALISNGNGPPQLAMDLIGPAAAVRRAELAPATRRALEGMLEPDAASANPVITYTPLTPERIRAILETVLDDAGVDGVLVLLAPDALADMPALLHGRRRHAAFAAHAGRRGHVRFPDAGIRRRRVWRAGVPPLQPAVAAADAAAGTPQPRAGPGRGARSHRAGARRLPARIEHV
ncbi:hypothetical protein G6F57_017619 [Rhizopus arrhizus]|nr:hypothetical protein G6F57_017619 [Rhizopus arrhizus]